MAYRLFANQLVALGLGASLLISGCTPVVTPGVPTVTVTRANMSAEEIELQRRSSALQRTIIEGAAAGAAAGAALSLASGSDNFWRDVAIGAVVGAVAGGYVANLQRNFASREEQLAQARSDIRATNAEASATLQVMRSVQRREIAEVRELRAAVAAGRADSASLDARIRTANANLADMNGAIEGAEDRAAEFGQAQAVLAGDGGENINAELANLQNRIVQMRAVAEDLSENL